MCGILKKDLGLDTSCLFFLSRQENSLQQPRMNKIPAENRFSHKVVDSWDLLAEELVSTPSIDSLKKK